MNSAQQSQTLMVPCDVSAKRLDVFLQREFPCISRSTLARLIRDGHVLVNGVTVKPSHQPRQGEQITIAWPELRPATPEPEPIPLDILYEDETLIVLNKPAGLVVHPAAGAPAGTLVNALLYHCRGELSGIAGVARPGIVHRLDRDTSGLMVVAKNDAGHLALSRQFARRHIEKVYHALVCGKLEPEAGEISAPIARHPSHRKMMAVIDKGRPAITAYRTIEIFRGATLVEARPRTGRTHQIRVHFKHIGFPLVGDKSYGKRPNAKLFEDTGYVAPRQMLHAQRLSFVHPLTQQTLTFEAPWPADFAEAVRQLRW
ncbi:MAG: RluA family pseudouridine synthase [Verrucomicrobiota bacterium]|nr:RluA family pseudouridine synthase [Verrucomicrobiota bacterium]